MKLSILPIVFCLSLALYGQQATVPSPGTSWQYVLLNDKSGRTLWPGGIEQQANAASQFLKEVVRPGSDVGSLVNFNDDFPLDVENSTNPDEIAAGISSPRPRRNTSVRRPDRSPQIGLQNKNPPINGN